MVNTNAVIVVFILDRLSEFNRQRGSYLVLWLCVLFLQYDDGQRQSAIVQRLFVSHLAAGRFQLAAALPAFSAQRLADIAGRIARAVAPRIRLSPWRIPSLTDRSF